MGFVAEDAAALGCETELSRLPDILSQGTSAHRQIDVYEKGLNSGRSQKEALIDVVDWLIEETAKGL